MPNLSHRSSEMPASPIRRLVPFAEAAQKRGIHIYQLNIGQPDVESPVQFWDALAKADLKLVAYSHSAGNASLRAKALVQFRGRGVDLQEGQLMVTTAGSEAIRFAFMACLNQGDEVIVPEPLYANYLGFAVEAGVRVVPITTRIEENFALPSISEFEAKIGPRTKAILICNPSNPTGTIFDEGELRALRDVALKHDLFLLADEVYREFNYTDKELFSVLQLEGLEKNAVMIDSVSKRYSLCGARIGFLASRNAEIMATALKFGQARLSPPTLEQIGVEGAMDTPPEYFAAVQQEYKARRDLLCSELGAMKGVLCPRIDGAFYATVRLPIDDCDEFCRWLLESFSYEGRTVMLAPGTGFYATPGLGRDEVRIAYVLKKPDLAAAMDCLRHALAAYPGRTCDQ
jgi:aspartate aminotransferase